ncbi:STM3941 family protein [Dongia sedimenti]|uniref:STM3941 family protein n=1 Tax=Dongia sedimenti TaxID=3064282 RepID=A0ABU0YKG7_9PROT|nr:STM3941 family protein [Rhodospirillaceae bacterium R-7]
MRAVKAFAGWDFGDTVRVAMVAGMVWLTIEAPATTTLPEPWATLSLTGYYGALASALFAPQFWARFGRPRARSGAAVILPGDRLFQIVTFLALLAATPQTILWAVETPTSEPWSLGFYWLCVALFVLAALVCLRNLLRSNALLRLQDDGIAAPRLWHAAIPWNALTAARAIGTRSNNALLLQFATPTELALAKRPWLDWSVRLGTEKRSVTIPGIMLGMPAETVARMLEDRIPSPAAPPSTFSGL